MPVQPARPRISTTEPMPRPNTAAKAKISRMPGDRGEDVVDPLEQVADLAAEEAGERRRAGCRSSSPASAAETPTRIEICAPLIALASTSRPSRSAPNGSVVGLDGSPSSGTSWPPRPIPCSAARAGRLPRCRRSGPLGAGDGDALGLRAGPDEAWAARRARRARPASRLATRPSAEATTSSRNSADDHQRDHADAVAAEAPRRGRPDAGRAPASARGAGDRRAR